MDEVPSRGHVVLPSIARTRLLVVADSIDRIANGDKVTDDESRAARRDAAAERITARRGGFGATAA
jgi:hypothetical protein